MITPKKSLSQNFLTDHNICKKILKQTEIKNKIILEIGPGYGILTDYILNKKPKKLILIEKDRDLNIFLKKKYSLNHKILILEKDILNFKINNFQNLIIISNLPYNISTKVILYLFNFHESIEEMVFMIQKEVALKFDYNLPRMNKYKFMTFIVSTYSRCFNISSKVFVPKPKINSTVVKFKFNKKNFDLQKAKKFSNLIFKNVRKKINNNIHLNMKDELLNKRVNELNINNLFDIYNFF